MAVIETILHSDLKHPVQVTQLSGNLFSADNGGNKITVEVTDNGSAASLSGNVTGYVIRPDNSTVVIEGTLSGNKASIILPASAYVVVGQVSIVVKLGTTTIGACTGYVYRTTTDAMVDPGSVVPSLAELLQKISDCEAATAAANAAATAAGYVNVTSSKSDHVVTIVTTNKNNQSTTTTITEPTASVAKSNGVITVTLTDSSGTTTVQYNVAEIDDTAGVGSTDKVWSADKLVKEFIANVPVIDKSISTEAAVQDFADGADGMPMKVVVGIEPVQDLHGYEYPWIGGAGKNKWSLGAFASWNNKPFSLPAGTYTVSVDASALVGMRFFYGEGNENSVVASLKESNNYTDTITLPSDCIKINTSVSEGGTVENVQIEAGETKTTYEPYENICPISGWTGAHIGLTGKNLIPGGTDTGNGYIAHKLIKPDGTTSTSEAVFVSEYFRVKPSTDYVYHYSSTSNASSVCFYDQAKNFIIGYKHGNHNNVSITTPLNAYFARATATYKDNDRPPIMFTEGTAFPTVDEWYTGQTYSISFPAEAGTVYGGTLTVNKDGSGTLVVDRAVLDISKRTWTYNSNGYFITSGSDIKRASSSSAVPDLLLSDRYKADTPTRAVSSDANLQRNGIMSIGVSNSTVIIRNYAYTDPTLFAASGGIVVYPLATPGDPIALTPGQVKSLLGYNAIWADTGNIKSVEYCADSKLYIEASIASAFMESVASVTETQEVINEYGSDE